MAAPLPQFAEAVRRYCDWCEGEPQGAKEEAQTAFDLLVTLLAGMPAVQGGYGWGRHATAALYALHCWLVDNRNS